MIGGRRFKRSRENPFHLSSAFDYSDFDKGMPRSRQTSQECPRVNMDHLRRSLNGGFVTSHGADSIKLDSERAFVSNPRTPKKLLSPKRNLSKTRKAAKINRS